MPDLAAIRTKELYSPSSLLRWWLTGGLHGFLLTFALVLCFPDQSSREAGVRMICAQSFVLSTRLAFITNRWLSWADVTQLVVDADDADSAAGEYSGADDGPDSGAADFSDLAAGDDLAAAQCDRPPPLRRQPSRAASLPRTLSSWTLRALHTRAGHYVPCLIFTYGVTRWVGIETLSTALLGVGVSAICAVTDAFVFPRYGPVRFAADTMLTLVSRPTQAYMSRRREFMSKVKAT